MAGPADAPLRRVLPQRLIDVLISKASWWLPGFLTGLALLIEDRRRRAELAMYVLPKALESLWVVARERGLVFHTGNWGEGVLAGLGMGMVMVRYVLRPAVNTRLSFGFGWQSIYQNDPQHLSGLVRKILYQFIGPN